MSPLAELIRRLRGEDNFLAFERRAGVSRITLRQIEEGKPVRLRTLQQVAEHCKLSDLEWAAMLIAWLRTEMGEVQFKKLDIRPAPSAAEVKKLKAADELFLSHFHRLTNFGKAQILKAMWREEVLACLPAINEVWDHARNLDHALEHPHPDWERLAAEIARLEDSTPEERRPEKTRARQTAKSPK